MRSSRHLAEVEGFFRLIALGLVFAFAFFVASGMASGSTVHASTDEIRREIEDLRNRLNSIQGDMGQYERDLGQIRQQEEGVTRELSQAQVEMQQVESQLDEALVALQLAELQVDEAEMDLRDAEEELAYRTNLLNGRVRAMYELGTVSYFEVLFSSSSFSDFVRRFQTLQRIVNQDVSVLESVREQKEEVEYRREVWLSQKEDAATWKQRVAEKREELAVEVASYENRLDNLSSREQEYLDALNEMERRSEQIARDITEKQEELALAEGTPYLVWPLNQGTFWVSSPFGQRYHPILGQWRMHSGIDLAASTGTPIKSAASGVVLDAGWMGGYGLSVIVAHTSSVSTLYAHASTLRVESGQRVKEGDTVGLVGSTGMSTGPHLHFEVRVDGQVQDPTEYLPSR
ncbi:MAG: peptidoglycan DD-metalloendopeptidase family protein [Bacillota bacterium]